MHEFLDNEATKFLVLKITFHNQEGKQSEFNWAKEKQLFRDTFYQVSDNFWVNMTSNKVQKLSAY